MPPEASPGSKARLVSLLSAIILFLLPWTEVTCSGHRVATQTGIQATYGGMTIDESVRNISICGKTARDEDPPDLPAAGIASIALFVLICAAGLSFLSLARGVRMRVEPCLLSGVAALLLLAQAVVGFPIDKRVEPRGARQERELDAAVVKRTPWFWAACVALALPTVFVFIDRRKRTGAARR